MHNPVALRGDVLLTKKLKNMLFWKILGVIGTMLLAVDIFGTIHNFKMSRENRKLANANKKRSLENKSKIDIVK